MENLFKRKNSEINVSEILSHISDGEKKVFVKEKINSDWKLMFNYQPTEEENKLLFINGNPSQEESLKLKELQLKYRLELEEKDLNVVNTYLNILWELYGIDSSELDVEGSIIATSSEVHSEILYKQKDETEYKKITL
jgi:hypothetical protein